MKNILLVLNQTPVDTNREVIADSWGHHRWNCDDLLNYRTGSKTRIS